jgi:hypothetical protein
MLKLRVLGLGWKEIADILQTTDGGARAEFSREVKKAKEIVPQVGRSSSNENCCFAVELALALTAIGQ